VTPGTSRAAACAFKGSLKEEEGEVRRGLDDDEDGNKGAATARPLLNPVARLELCAAATRFCWAMAWGGGAGAKAGNTAGSIRVLSKRCERPVYA
jgi:hypothetical protein